MTDTKPAAIGVIDQQIKELDAIAKDTNETLNTVYGRERVAKWKARAAAALTQQIGEAEGRALATANPGPSFSNDLMDEFNDEVDFYRAHLTTLRSRLQKTGLG